MVGKKILRTSASITVRKPDLVGSKLSHEEVGEQLVYGCARTSGNDEQGVLRALESSVY